MAYGTNATPPSQGKLNGFRQTLLYEGKCADGIALPRTV
jgi:hypothetical protein